MSLKIIKSKTIFVLLSVLLGLFVSFLSPIEVQAHQLPNGVNHNTFLTVENDKVILKYDLFMYYTDLSFFYDELDQNKDEIIDDKESANWLQGLMGKIYIQSKSVTYNPLLIKEITNQRAIVDELYPKVEFTLDFGVIPIPDEQSELTIHNSFRIRTNDPQDWNFAHDNQFFDLQNIEILNDNLTAKWQSILNYETKSTSPESMIFTNLTSPNWLISSKNTLEQLLNSDQFSPIAILTLILVSFLFGMAHTLTPGHGKGVITAYIASIRGGFKDILIMALSIVISHVGVVIAVAFIFAFLRNGLSLIIPLINLPIIIPPINLPQILPYLNIISGILIIMIGMWLFRRRLLEFINHRINTNLKITHSHQHSISALHHHEKHTHSHEVHATKTNDEATFHIHEEIIDHGDHIHIIPKQRLNLQEAISLGLSTGINPCIDAVAILILALNLDKVWLGIGIIIIFSIGMASTLTGIGWIISKGLNANHNKSNKMTEILDWLPIISTLLIILTGLLLII